MTKFVNKIANFLKARLGGDDGQIGVSASVSYLCTVEIINRVAFESNDFHFFRVLVIPMPRHFNRIANINFQIDTNISWISMRH